MDSVWACTKDRSIQRTESNHRIHYTHTSKKRKSFIILMKYLSDPVDRLAANLFHDNNTAAAINRRWTLNVVVVLREFLLMFHYRHQAVVFELFEYLAHYLHWSDLHLGWRCLTENRCENEIKLHICGKNKCLQDKTRKWNAEAQSRKVKRKREKKSMQYYCNNNN